MNLIYAPGDNWGHLNRSMGLARAASELGESVEVLTTSDYIHHVNHQVGRVRKATRLQSLEDGIAKVKRMKAGDTLIVDTFDRGPRGELAAILPALECKKVLVARDVVSFDMRQMTDSETFRKATYDMVFDIEKEPWIYPTSEPVGDFIPIVVLASGERDELDWYGEVCRLLEHDSYVCVAASLPNGTNPGRYVRYWPGVDYVLRAGVVVGSGGYNTVNECAWANVPLVARPWLRKYDDQLKRARNAGAVIVQTPQEAVAAIETAQKLKPVKNHVWAAAKKIWSATPETMVQKEGV